MKGMVRFQNKKAIFSFFSFVCSLLFVTGVWAQNDSTQHNSSPFFVRAAFQHLRSTHTTFFNGVSVDGNYQLSPHFALGAGIQYAGCGLHNDNNWVLTHLRLFPLYTSQLYILSPFRRVQPYLHTEEGISSNHYHKLDTDVAPKPYKVSEKGLYLAMNTGVNVVVRKRIKLFAELGYKGYKHSANALDVNPHGLTKRIGIEL